jgi:hypothetical protein
MMARAGLARMDGFRRSHVVINTEQKRRKVRT